MIDGQKINIPLDSDLDTSSSDMLVSVQSPTFLHNRQRFQGKYLPTSVRYEKDGWAVDWDVYNFEIASDEYDVGSGLKIRLFKKDSVTRQIVVYKDGESVGNLLYNKQNENKTADYIKSIITSGSSVVLSVTYNSVDFTITINRVTGTVACSDPRFEVKVVSDDYSYITLNVTDTENTLSFDAKNVYKPSAIKNDYVEIPFESFDGVTSTWQSDESTITFNKNTEVVSTNMTVKNVSTTVDREKLSTSFDTDHTINCGLNFQTETFFAYINGIICTRTTAIGTSSKKSYSRVTSGCSSYVGDNLLKEPVLFRNSDTDFSKLVFVQEIPVWIGVKLDGSHYVDTTDASVVSMLEVGRLVYGDINCPIYAKTTGTTTVYNKNIWKHDVTIWEHCRSNKSDDTVASRYDTACTSRTAKVKVKFTTAVEKEKTDDDNNDNGEHNRPGNNNSLQYYAKEEVEQEYTITCRNFNTIDISSLYIDYSAFAREWTSIWNRSLVGYIEAGSLEILEVTAPVISSGIITGKNGAWITSATISGNTITAINTPYKKITGLQVVGNSYAVCITGYVQGVITQNTKLVTQSNYSTAYSFSQGFSKPHSGSVCLDINGDNLFKLSIANLIADEKSFKIGIALNAVNSNTYLFGYNYTGTNQDGPSVVMPMHFVTGELLDAVTNDYALAGSYIDKFYDMTNITGSITVNITGIIADQEVYKYITDCVSSVAYNSLLLNEWLNDNLALFDAMSKTVGDIDFSYDVTTRKFTAQQNVTLKLDNNVIDLKFNGLDIPQLTVTSVTINGKTLQMELSGEKMSELILKFLSVQHFDFVAQLPVCFCPDYEVTAASVNTISVKHFGNTVVLNTDSLSLSRNGKTFQGAEVLSINAELGIYFNLSFVAVDDVSMSAKISKIYDTSSTIEVLGYDSDKITVKYNGATVVINTANVEARYNATFTAKYTDIRDKDMKEHTVLSQDASSEYTFIRQQWDTNCSTEKFWWIDSEHILVLTNNKLIRRRKTNKLDHWYGDVWEDEYTQDRSSILTTEVLRYICSNSYNGSATKFVTMGTINNKIWFRVYDPLHFEDGSITYEIPLTIVGLGNKLNSNNRALYTYSNIVINNLVSTSAITATSIDNKLVLGIHYDKNFNQWAIVFEGNSYSIIQGYGFVGVNGDLTGGEIPAKYFDVNLGFNSTVSPLSTLSNKQTYVSSTAEIMKVKERIVGTDSQQWYIASTIDSIVSHLNYDTSAHKFVVRSIPLTNHYEANYASPSYGRATFSRWSFQMKALSDLFYESNGTVQKMLSYIASPSVVFIEPRFSLIAYGQQTLGQYAYVHYNNPVIIRNKEETNENVMDDDYQQEVYEHDMNAQASNLRDTSKPRVHTKIYEKPVTAVSSDELAFDVQSVSQKISVGSSIWNDAIWSVIAATAAAAIDAADVFASSAANSDATTICKAADVSINSTQQNLLSMGVSNFVTQGLSPTVSTEVTAVKTLDMFYSTSDSQEVCAGPGYVNHNFVAQCVAQSVTSTQLEGIQLRTMFLIKALTMYPLNAALQGLKLALDIADTTVNANSGAGVTGFLGGYTNGAITSAAGTAAAAAGISAKTVAFGAYYAAKTAVDAVESILDSMGANNFRAHVHARLWKHGYDNEGKHNYGERQELFMYPCFDCGSQKILDESVTAVTMNKPWELNMNVSTPKATKDESNPDFTTDSVEYSTRDTFKGKVKYLLSSICGTSRQVTLPNDMAYILGVEKFLPDTVYRNKNISESEPTFPTPIIQDYIIDKRWQLAHTASASTTVWISCKDTKLLDGNYSNVVVSSSFCGVANSYAAIEIKQGISREYLRPYAVTPKALAINTSGFNCFYDRKAYHGFDGYGCRIVNWVGSPGMGKNFRNWQYSFIKNDRFKRSNIIPANEILGNFKSEPNVALTTIGDDEAFSLVTQPSNNRGMIAGASGEDKDATRYSLPIFTEMVNTLPAAVKTLSTVPLYVDSGITNLVTTVRDMQMDYKSPVSVDFNIGKNRYRFTNEYICSLTVNNGVTVVETLVPCLGLEFLGSTPYEAYFYSPATRIYYSYTGSTALQQINMIERFRDVINGRYDFINQEVIMPCLATFNRLNPFVLDAIDETDNIIVPRLKDNRFIGELEPPITNIFSNDSWYKVLSLPSGVCYQGPNRCIINRFVLVDYMVDQIKNNLGKWEKVPKEKYNPFRKYKASYSVVNEDIGDELEIKGWTHNPFLLVTSALGLQSEQDCIFEWEITFCWPIEMDYIYDKDNYAVVNIYAETMTPGGKVNSARPTHVYLTKELFTRNENYGYYSFRYQSKNGIGNRERLHIWSDQYIAVSSLQVEYKVATQKRTEQLTQQLDIQNLKEL